MIAMTVTRMHRLSDGGNLKAFVDVALNESFLLKGLRVVQGRKDVFVSMPREKGKDGRWYETVHPLTKDVKNALSKAVLDAYKRKDGEKDGV